MSGVIPSSGLKACLLQHPAADADDHPGFFHHRYEVVGHHETSCGVLPTQQRFDAVDSRRAKIEDRLIHEEEFVARHGITEVALQLYSITYGCLHLLREHPVTVLAC